jgi:hypothetical protein
MNTLAIIVTSVSAATAVISVLIAYWAARESRKSANATATQAERAAEANFQARQIGQSEAVIHFTSRFFDLMKEGAKFTDRNWAYQYWSLQATEFYFFHNDWIPLFMYRLWMVELASTYSESEEVWKSHERYLNYYSSNYSDMCDFFNEIRTISTRHQNDLSTRNRKVEEFVNSWKREHEAITLQEDALNGRSLHKMR